jgi:two-component system, OmpR family, response regulator
MLRGLLGSLSLPSLARPEGRAVGRAQRPRSQRAEIDHDWGLVMEMIRDVLLVVGEEQRADVFAQQLVLDGYEARRARSAAELRARCCPGDVGLVFFSGSLEPGRCLDGLRALRAGDFAPHVSPDMGVLWGAGAAKVGDVVRAFEAGADDVIRTPFAYAELLARVRAILHRTALEARKRAPEVLRYDALEVDTEARTVRFGSTSLDLRPQEYGLLVQLLREPARVFTKKELLQSMWGCTETVTRTVDTHATRLRRTLARAGAEGWVPVVWGIGYRLAPDTHVELRVLDGGAWA